MGPIVDRETEVPTFPLIDFPLIQEGIFEARYSFCRELFAAADIPYMMCDTAARSRRSAHTRTIYVVHLCLVVCGHIARLSVYEPVSPVAYQVILEPGIGQSRASAARPECRLV